MYEIIYSPVVQEKLAALKLKLVEMCGENVGIKHFSQVIDGFEVRLTFSNTGILNTILSYIPIKTIFCTIPKAIRYMLWRYMMKGKILQGRCLESSLPVKRLWNIGVNRRTHVNHIN